MEKKSVRKFPDGILNYTEAAKMLGCSRRTLQRYKVDKKIPEKEIYRMAARVGFTIKGLQEIIKNGGIQ